MRWNCQSGLTRLLEPVDGESPIRSSPSRPMRGADGDRQCAGQRWKESSPSPGGQFAGTAGGHEGQRKVDKDGRQSEEQVDAGVPPLAVREVEEGDGALESARRRQCLQRE
jgi:hypothetical protein